MISVKSIVCGGSIALACMIVVTGCGEKDEAKTAVQAAAHPPELSGEQASDKTNVVNKATLLRGYTPSFRHRVRSKREDRLPDGKIRKIAIVEYYISDEEVGRELEAGLKARGLSVRGPEPRKGAERYTAQNSKVGRMTADVNPDPQLSLPSGAQGIIYFSWIEFPAEK